MQIVNVRFHVKPELADAFPAAIADLVDATRAEPGNLWYLWSRSLDDPSEFVVLEGCTIECKSLAENGHLIREYDVAYLMASVDSLEDNKGFAKETAADFPLLSDPTKKTAEAYDVLVPVMGFAKRHTFYIGKDGRILKIDTDIKPETSAEDMATTLGELGVAKR